MGGNELVRWRLFDQLIGIPDPNALTARLCLSFFQAMCGKGANSLDLASFLPRKPIDSEYEHVDGYGTKATMRLLSGLRPKET